MAKTFTELIAWQRADELERFVAQMVRHSAVATDYPFCRQALDAAASAPRNIAEGFGRFAPTEFAHFLRIAIGSEQETKNHILKAWQRGALDDEGRDAGVLLVKRAVTAAVRLRSYLLTSAAKANARRIENP